MNRPSAIRCGVTIMSAIWHRHQRSLVGIFTVAMLFGAVFRVLVVSPENEIVRTIRNLGMGLSIFLTFVICGFTEADRKVRSWGFPARLFTLPVSTWALVGAPMLFGILTIGLVYLAWAGFALSDQELPLTWPLLYLGVGMICYQCVLWSMARFRITRIIVLGYAGALFAMGWMAFRVGGGAASSSDWDLSDATRRVLLWMLVAMGVVAYGVARIAVDVQRRGGLGRWRFGRWTKAPAEVDLARAGNDALREGRMERDARGEVGSFQPRRFGSGYDAQFWLEWRRHGKLLPLATAGVLFMIMIPAPFSSPISSGMTVLALCWIVATPLLIAFVLGRGMGKPDLWSGDSGCSLFLATRPLSNTQWIGAKMKMGAAAALAAWGTVVVATSGWLWLWCDREQLWRGWAMLEQSCAPLQLYGASAAVFLILGLLTFRFLVGSLYIGLSGKSWLMNLAACGVFSAMFGGMFGAIAVSQGSIDFRWLVERPRALAVGLGTLFAIKLAVALMLAWQGCEKGWLTLGAVRRYAVFWMVATGALVGGVWSFPLVDESWKWVLVALVVFIVPVLRVALAPMMLAGSFRR
jgi:hypothetical protein